MKLNPIFVREKTTGSRITFKPPSGLFDLLIYLVLSGLKQCFWDYFRKYLWNTFFESVIIYDILQWYIIYATFHCISQSIYCSALWFLRSRLSKPPPSCLCFNASVSSHLSLGQARGAAAYVPAGVTLAVVWNSAPVSCYLINPD